jgi:hypothetical protein
MRAAASSFCGRFGWKSKTRRLIQRFPSTPRSSSNRDTLLYFADDLDMLAAEAEEIEQAQRRKAAAC